MMFDARYTRSPKHLVGQFDVRAYRTMVPAGPAEGRFLGFEVRWNGKPG
jgi:hypothetical protein